MTKWLNDFYCFFIRWPCKSTTSSTIITSTAIHTLLSIHTILTYTDTCIQTYNNNAYRQHTVRCIHWRTIFIFSPSHSIYKVSTISWSVLPCDTLTDGDVARFSLALGPRWLLVSAGKQCWYNVTIFGEKCDKYVRVSDTLLFVFVFMFVVVCGSS